MNSERNRSDFLRVFLFAMNAPKEFYAKPTFLAYTFASFAVKRDLISFVNNFFKKRHPFLKLFKKYRISTQTRKLRTSEIKTCDQLTQTLKDLEPEGHELEKCRRIEVLLISRNLIKHDRGTFFPLFCISLP